MYERLKRIRKTIKLTQSQFAASLGLGQSTYAMMEVGKRDILDRHIKTICALYNVNEEWFRTGNGDMFRTPFDSFLKELSAKYNIDDTVKAVITAYLELDTHERATVTSFIARVSSLTAGAVPIPSISPEPNKNAGVPETAAVPQSYGTEGTADSLANADEVFSDNNL